MYIYIRKHICRCKYMHVYTYICRMPQDQSCICVMTHLPKGRKWNAVILIFRLNIGRTNSHESDHIHMRHVTIMCVMSHSYGSCQIRMSHVQFICVMSHSIYVIYIRIYIYRYTYIYIYIYANANVCTYKYLYVYIYIICIRHVAFYIRYI